MDRYTKPPVEIAREFFPLANVGQLSDVLFCCTGFPAFFAPGEGETVEDVLRRQLSEFSEKSSGDAGKACWLAEQEMDAEMAKYREPDVLDEVIGAGI